jgi:hypothetical protein
MTDVATTRNALKLLGADLKTDSMLAEQFAKSPAQVFTARGISAPDQQRMFQEIAAKFAGVELDGCVFCSSCGVSLSI